MNILHISAHALRGGCEKNCYYFIQYTPNFHHEIIVLNGDGPMLEEWASLGITVKTLNILQKNIIRFYRALRRALPQKDLTKVIVWTNTRMPLVIAALSCYKDVSVYVHVGNPVYPGINVKLKNMLLSFFLPKKSNVCLRPVSRYVNESIVDDFYYKKFPARVSLKPIKVSEVLISAPSELTPASRVELGMVARLDHIKDHNTVIRAFALISRKYPLAVLHLVGDGPLMRDLTKTAFDCEVGDRIVFHGDVADVYKVMKDWNVFLYATTLNEGLGGTIPEALSTGLPVISVDLPMTREWDPGGQFVTFCKPFDPEDMAAKADILLRNLIKRSYIYENAPKYIATNFSPSAFSINYIQ